MTPISSSLVPKLLGQLVAPALVATVGALLLNNLANPARTAPDAAAVPTAISTEAVFKATPRAETRVEFAKAATPRPAPRPKTVAASTPSPPRTLSDPAPVQTASVSAPLPIVPPAAEQPVAREGAIASRWHRATAAVKRLPQWASNSMSGWFTEVAPPRPPIAVPTADFQASM